MNDASIERIRAALAHLNPHDRNEWVRAAFSIKSELGEDGFDLWDSWGSDHKRPASEVKATWKSASDGGKRGIGSLFRDAKLAGWKDDAHYEKPSKEVIQQRQKAAAERKAERAAEELLEQAAAAATATRIWDASTPATVHPYLSRKGVSSHGLRIGSWEYEDKETGETYSIPNCLLIPMRDRQRNLHSLQCIEPHVGKSKRYLKGGLKRGNFLPIGKKPIEQDGAPVFVLAEGYATAASVHESTGHLVLVCFDASNLMPVATEVRQRAPGAIILFAADNDIWTDGNPGVSLATAAAKAVGGLVVFPPFTQSDTSGEDDKGRPQGPTDFNDWHLVHGGESVAEIIASAFGTQPAAEPAAEAAAEPTLPPDETELDELTTNGHFVILGYDGDHYYFFHQGKKQVLSKTRGDFTDIGLVEMAPLNWWESYFPAAGGKGGINKLQAAEWIFDVAHARGVYDPRRVRGRGAWHDNSRVVFHHGDYLSVDGARCEIAEIDSRWVYPMSQSMPAPSDSPATDAEGQHLLDITKMARWSRPGSAPLLAGWVFLSPVCGALSWRPHIWLTGPAGSGKSTMMEDFAQALLSGVSEPFQGDSTEAGIRQTLGADAMPVLIDEFEPNDEADRKKMKSMLTLMRQASSESSARTVKGTISGAGMKFHIRSMFCLASINTMLDKDSDQSRITTLVMRPGAKSGAADDQWPKLEEALHCIKKNGKWPARLLARSLSMLSTIIANVDVFTKVAAQRFGTQRQGDQYGTLLAGAWCLTHGTVATDKEAGAMIDGYDWSEHKDSGDGLEDSAKALASIMEAKIRVLNTDVTVYEILAEAAGQSASSVIIGRETCNDILIRNGIRIVGKDAVFANASKALRKLVEDTPYATDLRGQLRRLAGAHVHENKTLKFAGVTSKVVAVPLALILGFDEPPI